MATSQARPGPQPAPTPQTPAQIKQSQFDLAISLHLHLWSALSTAVANSWGGPDSSGKRDWFAGAISDLFLSRPDTDQEDLECVLLQIMEDEFDIRLEDESEVEVAGDILRMRRWCERGDFSEIEKLQRKWESRRGSAGPQVVFQESKELEVGDEEWSDEEEEDGGVELDEDEEMADEAPQLAPVKEKAEPEVDDDGFTKVSTKKKR